MTKRHLCLALLTVTTVSESLAFSGESARKDSVVSSLATALEHHNLSLSTQNAWWQNPALHFDAYSSSYSILSVYSDKRREEEAFVMQEGRALQNIGIKAMSYRRLYNKHMPAIHQPQTIVWGEASYQKGLRENVNWNASADWRTIYPYVLADTLGGDRNTEQYAFQGGCATRLGRWTVGEGVVFRAEHEWSTRDPRMRGIVTEVKAQMGLSRRWVDYELALGGMLKLYKQTNSVEFYREEGKIPEYQMMGLGNWYERFSGTNNKAYYKGNGNGVELGLRPTTDKGGLMFTTHYEYLNYKRILSTLNALPISKLYVTQWNTRLGWKGRVKNTNEFWVWMGLESENRCGDEIIAGESIADEYVARGYLTMYKNRTTDLHGAMMIKFALSPRNMLNLRLQGGQKRYTSSYAYPYSALNYRKHYVDGTLQWQTTKNRWLLALDTACRYSRNVSGSFITTSDEGYTSPLKKDVALAKKRMTEQCAAQALASYLSLSCGLHAEWQPHFLDNMGLFFETRAVYRANNFASGNHGYLLHTSVGITF